jgi:hypothetical protein
VFREALDSKSVMVWERKEDSQQERSQSPRLSCLFAILVQGLV